MAGRGRPKKECSKKTKISIRLDDDCSEQLRYLLFRTDKSVTEIVMKGIKLLYNLEKNKV